MTKHCVESSAGRLRQLEEWLDRAGSEYRAAREAYLDEIARLRAAVVGA